MISEVGEVFQSDLLFVKFYFGEITIQIIYQTNCAVNVKKYLNLSYRQESWSLIEKYLINLSIYIW